MIWDTTTQLIVIGMAAFCISFGVIYSLIFCYKSRRKSNSEENQRLRDGLLPEKFRSLRKSTSLSSESQSSCPPLSDSVINPHYNASPYKVAARHLRPTSASYSPTHYLSPHHRRNSTPTQPQCNASSECSCCGCPRGITKSKSPNSEHSVPSTSSSSTSLSTKSRTHQDLDSNTNSNINVNSNCSCSRSNAKSPLELRDERKPNDCQCTDECSEFLSTHKCKLIPTSTSTKMKYSEAKYKNGNSWDSHYCHQKSFSFGPIPARKKRVEEVGESLRNTNSPNPNINLSLKKNEECGEEHPLLKIKTEDEKKTEIELEKGTFVHDSGSDKASETDGLLSKGKEKSMIYIKHKSYTPDLFKKENIVQEEIPYYIEQFPMGCN